VTYQVWQDCPACEGAGGYVVDGEWVDCEQCEGAEGWMVEPEPEPSAHVVAAPAEAGR
jgi:DnaJ-class molecular chaperone